MLRSYYSTKTTSGFGSFTAFYDRLRAGSGLRNETEVMCHPGGTNFKTENELLGGTWKQELPPGTQLISYNGL
jgi:hypothetical protein